MLVGSDAEVSLIKEERPISAIGLLHGTKDNPRPTKNGWVQEDNVAAEINIHPASTAEEFADNFEKVFMDLEEMIVPIGCIIQISPSLIYPEEELLHPCAREAGCYPDNDAWIMQTNFPPDLSQTLLRTFGAHVHVSWDFDPIDFDERRNMIRAMDLTLGIPSILLDEDNRRRELYGKAGAHRNKMYGDKPGVEWRVASNWWIRKRDTIEWTFHNTAKALEIKDEINWDEMEVIRDTINNGDRETAVKLIDHFGIQMP